MKRQKKFNLKKLSIAKLNNNTTIKGGNTSEECHSADPELFDVCNTNTLFTRPLELLSLVLGAGKC